MNPSRLTELRKRAIKIMADVEASLAMQRLNDPQTAEQVFAVAELVHNLVILLEADAVTDRRIPTV